MDARTVAGGYAIAVGLLMVLLWTVLLGTGQVPELRTATVEVGLHVLAEVLTALALLVSGVGVLRGHPLATRGLSVALGMLGYTVINSAGYYGQLGDWPIVGLFAVLGVLTVRTASWAVRGTLE